MLNINSNELFLYRQLEDQATFDSFVWVINNYSSVNYEEIRKSIYTCVNSFVEAAQLYGFEGNLWHCYLTFSLVNSENSFTRALEIGGSCSGTLNDLARQDLSLFKKLYDFDIRLIDKVLGINCLSFIADYNNSDCSRSIISSPIIEHLRKLNRTLSTAGSDNEFYDILTTFYKQHGCGKFALYKAYRIASVNNTPNIIPITATEDISFADLVGYEFQKEQLIKNTDGFIKGYKANNVLLYGDSGTGKSSSIKAVLNKYCSRGLRMIEVYKHQFGYLQEIIGQLKDRGYKFIIYMDDLSFEEYETDYKYLKAIIEGGLEIHPNNILLYATSNRRHLIREKWSDKADRDDDLHTNDTVQEKLSLAARFGLSILYISPNKKEFNNIVKVLAEKNNIVLSEEELFLEANRWEMRHGGLSGRTAQHFITYITAKMLNPN